VIYVGGFGTVSKFDVGEGIRDQGRLLFAAERYREGVRQGVPLPRTGNRPVAGVSMCGTATSRLVTLTGRWDGMVHTASVWVVVVVVVIYLTRVTL
jgi:hypothetical protein